MIAVYESDSTVFVAFPVHFFLVFSAAFVASMINAIAGGGTFITFPTLTGPAGLSEKVANMTSNVGLWPGFVASVAAARLELAQIPRGRVVLFAAISVVGATLGALLLQYTSSKAFAFAIPWLLAFATALFAFSKPIGRWAGHQHGKATPGWTAIVCVIQFFVATYGGYFGAGMGVLMLAGLAFAGLEDIRHMNALKALLGALINGIAGAIFIVWPLMKGSPDRVDWQLAAVMAVAAIIGGFVGIRLSRKIKQDHLRFFILAVGVFLSAWYFYKVYVAK
jgi:uncharacterized membrane protein YfcA